MNFTSERITRFIILFLSRTVQDKNIRNSIKQGSELESDSNNQTVYFKFGAGIFMLLGFITILISIISVILTIVFHGLLGGWFFFYYAPGLVLYCIGANLSFKEKQCSKGINAQFSTKSLIFSTLCGILCALFITSFSILNAS